MSKKVNWNEVEKMAVSYNTTTNEWTKEEILAGIYEELHGYIKTSTLNAVRDGKGVNIPKEDFESYFYQYLWEAVKSYDPNGESELKHIIQRRFRFGKIHAARLYKTKGDESDKNGVSYAKARWDSLDREVDNDSGKTLADVVLGATSSAELVFLDIAENEEDEILNQFELLNPRYANIIKYIAKGYEGDELAIISGEDTTNSAKVRKLVERAKKSFAKFLENN